MSLEKIRENAQGTSAKIIISVIILSFALAGVSSYLVGSSAISAVDVNGESIDVVDFDRAFNNERAERLQSLTVPTTILRWAGSLLREQADRLDEFRWPDHITMTHSDASLEARFNALREAILESVRGC